MEFEGEEKFQHFWSFGEVSGKPATQYLFFTGLEVTNYRVTAHLLKYIFLT